jgi:uncharacterized membrane protein YphA (DoxX/SURF4 family)
MQRSTAVFLVLLRLAIGCHFLYEGLHKLHSMAVGPSETTRPFSSAGYFREAQGPLGGVMRSQIGDPDEEALARLVPLPMTGDKDPAKDKAHLRIPAALAEDWDDWFKLFCTAQGLDPQQKKQADEKLLQAKNQVVLWLEKGEEEVAKTYPSGTVKVTRTTAKRVQAYQEKQQEVREMLAVKLRLFDQDVEKARLVKAKTEAAQMRTGLVSDLKKKTAEMKKLVADVLTKQQREDLPRVLARMQAMDVLLSGDTARQKQVEEENENLVHGLKDKSEKDRETILDPLIVSFNRKPLDEKTILLSTLAPEQRRDLQVALMSHLSDRDLSPALWVARTEVYRALEQVEANDVPDRPVGRKLYWLDTLTAWGLTIMGACLVLGLLTRLNCVLLAGFLFLTYLAVPAFPWLPTPPNSEGNYFFVNKNLIEMFALLALATTQSGRWLGLDAWLHRLFTAFRRQPNYQLSEVRQLTTDN